VSMEADMADVSVTMADGIRRIDIDRLEMLNLALQNDIPTKVDIRMKGFRIETGTAENAPRTGKWRQLLQQAELRLAYLADPKNKQVVLDGFSFRMPEAGFLDLSLRLGNLDLENAVAASESPHFLILVIPGITVSRMEVTYRDDGFVQRFLEEVSAQAGLSRDEYLIELEAAMNELKKGGTSNRLDQALAAVSRFLRKPGHLHMVAAPEKPIPLGQFMFSQDRGMLFDMLQVQVETGTVHRETVD